MSLVERKEVEHKGCKYIVSRAEFNDRVEYQAWEPMFESITRPKGASYFASHEDVYRDDKGYRWGSLDSRSYPDDIHVMTPCSPERLKEEEAFWRKTREIATLIIKSAFKVAGTPDERGKIVAKRNTKVELPESKNKPTGRSSVIRDGVRDLLEAAAFPRLKQLAKLNGVTVKDKDTAGLLKMRLMNALRHKIKKGDAIIEK